MYANYGVGINGGTGSWVFSPTTRTVQSGDTITFTNNHGSNSVTISCTGSEFTSQAIAAGATFVHRFITDGTFTVSASGAAGTCVVTVT
jgi:plastocyanin